MLLTPLGNRMHETVSSRIELFQENANCEVDYIKPIYQEIKWNTQKNHTRNANKMSPDHTVFTIDPGNIGRTNLYHRHMCKIQNENKIIDLFSVAITVIYIIYISNEANYF